MGAGFSYYVTTDDTAFVIFDDLIWHNRSLSQQTCSHNIVYTWCRKFCVFPCGIIFFVVSTVVFVVFVQFDAEFRRFSVSRQTTLRFDDFYRLVEEVHCLQSVPFIITYTDPEGDLLPINNDDNFAVAFSSAQPVLRLHIQQKGVMTYVINDLLFLHITDNSSWFLVQKKIICVYFFIFKNNFFNLNYFLCCCETTL